MSSTHTCSLCRRSRSSKNLRRARGEDRGPGCRCQMRGRPEPRPSPGNLGQVAPWDVQTQTRPRGRTPGRFPPGSGETWGASRMRTAGQNWPLRLDGLTWVRAAGACLGSLHSGPGAECDPWAGSLQVAASPSPAGSPLGPRWGSEGLGRGVRMRRAALPPPRAATVLRLGERCSRPKSLFPRSPSLGPALGPRPCRCLRRQSPAELGCWTAWDGPAWR